MRPPTGELLALLLRTVMQIHVLFASFLIDICICKSYSWVSGQPVVKQEAAALTWAAETG